MAEGIRAVRRCGMSTRTLRELEAAREDMQTFVRLGRTFSAIAISTLVLGSSGIPTAYITGNAAFVVITVVFWIATIVSTVSSIYIYSEKVSRSRQRLRSAQWAYEDAVMKEAGA